MKKTIILHAFALLICITACQPGSEKTSVEVNDVQLEESEIKSEEKLIKSASINVKVKDAKNAAKQISGLTSSVGGMIMNHLFELNQIDSKEIKKSEDSLMVVSSFSPIVHLSVRVPSDSLANFLAVIQDENEMVSRMEYDVKDMGINYRENSLRNQLRQKYLNKKSGEKSLTDSLAIAIGDNAVTHQISNERINRDVAYSNVDLDISQSPIVRKMMVANSDLSAYKPGLALRFSEALAAGSDLFINILIFFSQFWLFFAAALLSWIGFRYYKLHKKGKLMVAAQVNK